MLCSRHPRRRVAAAIVQCLAGAFFLCASTPQAQAQRPGGIVHRVSSASDRLEMIVNTSRILTLDSKIPKFQSNNPDILTILPLAENQIQLSAKKAGVTQVNLWNEAGDISTVDVVVVGDSQELERVLQVSFPDATLRVRPLATSVILTGFVDDQRDLDAIVRTAQDYYPNVINQVRVGGVQQVLLKVKVMEVSRTKLRSLGSDWVYIDGDDFVASGVGGLLATFNTAAGGVTPAASGLNDTFRFGVVDGDSAFFGFLDLLAQRNMLKVVAEPQLVAISGRPAQMLAGGEFPILVPQSLGTVAVQFRPYGTQVDFVPLVLGNGLIHLDVRPEVSEIDPSTGTQLNGVTVPGRRTRRAETGVEMRAGQTMAIAGLIQSRSEDLHRGIPLLMDIPIVGAAFGRRRNTMNEVELLILVTPELVEAMDCDQVPPCGPGEFTDVPNDCELYVKNYMEVPSRGPCGNQLCGQISGAEHVVGGYGFQGQDIPAGAIIQNESVTTPKADTLVDPAAQSIRRRSNSTLSSDSKVASRPRPRVQSENRSARPNGSQSTSQPSKPVSTPGFYGQTGYDDLK